MADFRVGIEPPIRTAFGDVEIWGCGPWCQGPMLLQALNILEGVDLASMGHNSVAYLHTLAEAINLAAADRHAYYGDPRFVHVPVETLLSKEYAAERRRLIASHRAFGGMAPPGTVAGHAPGPGPYDETQRAASTKSPDGADKLDTSHVCVVDRWGNAFSATPSDSGLQAPVPPGLGFVPSPRGGQAWTDPRAPASIAPGKRPRLTPNPAIAIRRGEMLMPFGTPGADVQTQMMLQVFLNIEVFGMDPQSAVEAERFACHNFPGTHDPHDHAPGSLWLQGSMEPAIGEAIAALGHDIHWYPERGPANTSPDITRGVHHPQGPDDRCDGGRRGPAAAGLRIRLVGAGGGPAHECPCMERFHRVDRTSRSKPLSGPGHEKVAGHGVAADDASPGPLHLSRGRRLRRTRGACSSCGGTE